MSMDEITRGGFARLIAEQVPPATLEDIVAAQGVVEDFEFLQQSGSPDPDERRMEVATVIVDRYGALDALGDLALALRRCLRRDAAFIAKLTPYLPRRDTDGDNDAAKEAALVL